MRLPRPVPPPVYCADGIIREPRGARYPPRGRFDGVILVAEVRPFEGFVASLEAVSPGGVHGARPLRNWRDLQGLLDREAFRPRLRGGTPPPEMTL
jgi:hypothetical protein